MTTPPKLAFDPNNLSVQDEIHYSAVRSAGPEAVRRFVEMLRKGETVRLAAMLATQRAPTTGVSDHLFVKNKRSLLEQFNGSHVVMNAWKDAYFRRTGEPLPDDAVVFRSLASEVGDENAVLTHKRSLSEIKAAAAKRGLQVRGEWDQVPEPQPPKLQEVVIGADIIERYRGEYIAENPDLAVADQRELTERIIENHSRVVTMSDLEPGGAKTFKELCRNVFNVKDTGPVQLGSSEPLQETVAVGPVMVPRPKKGAGKA